jgi:hypothetical protein
MDTATNDKTPDLNKTPETFTAYLNAYAAALLGFTTTPHGDHVHFAAAQAFGVHDAKSNVPPCGAYTLVERINALMVSRPKG